MHDIGAYFELAIALTLLVVGLRAKNPMEPTERSRVVVWKWAAALILGGGVVARFVWLEILTHFTVWKGGSIEWDWGYYWLFFMSMSLLYLTAFLMFAALDKRFPASPYLLALAFFTVGLLFQAMPMV